MKPLRVRALERAHRYVGVLEKPPGSNRGALIDSWNTAAGVALGSPYCDTFGHAMYRAEGYELGGHFANADSYCPSTLAWGREQGFEVSRPFRGDVVLFDWNQDGVPDHFGFVDRVLALRFSGSRFVGLVRTVEANTGPGVGGNQSDGDGVHQRFRWVNSSTRFLRIPG